MITHLTMIAVTRILPPVLLGLLASCPVAAQTADVERIYRENAPAVFVVYGTRADNRAPVQGSGVCVDKRGYILVTAHQVDGVQNLTGRGENGRTYPLSVVHMDTALELALLKAEAVLPAAVPIGDAEQLANGAPLISIAAPMNLEFSVVPGTVASLHRRLNEMPVIQANLPAAHGSSGGPVFDRDGRLIGLISGELNEAQFTIVNKINNAYPLLRAAGILPPQQGTPEEELAPAAGISDRELRAVRSYNRGVRADRPADKLAAYGTAVALLPDFFEAWFNLALARAAAGDAVGAEEAYRKAAVLRPDAPEVPRNLGRLLRDLGRLEEAKRIFAEAAEHAPDSAPIQNDVGEVCRQLRQYEEAVRHFEKAIALAPDYAAAHFNLGITWAAMGNAARAMQHLERYLALEPEAADTREVRAALAEMRNRAGNAAP